jgi:hypothetical protein
MLLIASSARLRSFTTILVLHGINVSDVISSGDPTQVAKGLEIMSPSSYACPAGADWGRELALVLVLFTMILVHAWP